MAKVGVKKATAAGLARKAGVKSASGGPHGPALAQNRATQFDVNDSVQTTGNVNYKRPGYACGMS